MAGELNWTARADQEAIDAMVSGIAHRGPDERGLLSIADLSPAGHQPKLDSLTGNAIIFNGEIYNLQIPRDNGITWKRLAILAMPVCPAPWTIYRREILGNR